MPPPYRFALKAGFGEGVVARNMPATCQFLSHDSCEKRFLWAHEEVELNPHTVVGLALRAREAEKFPQALGLEQCTARLWMS